MTMKSFIFSRQALLVLMLGTSCCKVAAFHAHQPVLSKSVRDLKLSSWITTRMYIDGADIDTPLHLFSTQSSSPLPSHNIVPIILEPDPKLLEAEVLNDFSHVTLDLSTFFSPNTVVIRLLALVGRVLVLLSDYIQDQYISPDEWAFQLFMLTLSTSSFVKAARPMIVAATSNTTLTVRDRKAYSLLFGFIGMSILQFKTLLACGILEWVTFGPNEEISMNGEYIYWLYTGGITSSTRDCNSTSYSLSSRIYGEVEFAKKLQEPLRRATKKSKARKEGYIENVTQAIETEQGMVYVGSGGAILLRIDTTKLLELMNDDDELSVSIQRLVLTCMQEKLTRASYEGDDARNSSIPIACS